MAILTLGDHHHILLRMKLVSLNIWEGELYQPLVDFLNKHKPETDIFCFQEVFKAEAGIRRMNPEKLITFKSLVDILSDFNGYFEDYVAPGDYEKEGLAVFAKKSIKVSDRGEIFIYSPANIGLSNDNPKSLWRNLQYLKCGAEGKEFLIANMHGLFDFATKTHKGDIPERIEQSRRAKALLDKFDCPKILCGDLNLWPDTESLKILEEGMVNLVKEHNVFSTRSAFFEHSNRFADYVLVSLEIKVNDFRVLDEVVSDHLALYLDFEF